ncbi:7-dehydrocholesterol reductase-like [Humulus lupulus]|uniref:7-dehydrocholesterol reductase-like n=1 Tax=Humulus lupulus TaxID=3486 RepID=UPI002B40D8FD|nr:7-dehydrocholesterol reductase-like [Humulus lupulus]
MRMGLHQIIVLEAPLAFLYEVNGKVADSMLVNTILMLVYVTKFFWWEAGYWSTMDIAHDRVVYFALSQLALYILVAGILCIYINYDCDRQRQEFRRTNGKALVWGKAPSKITATYTTTTGETKSSILLTSGWLYPTFMWCFLQSFSSAGRKGMMIGADPSKQTQSHHLFMKNYMSLKKLQRYGKYWKSYCEKVRYRVIPGIY